MDKTYVYNVLLQLSMFPVSMAVASFIGMTMGTLSWRIFMALLCIGFSVFLVLLILWWYDTYRWFL